MPFVQDNDLVQTLFSHAAHSAFRVGIEIGRPRRQLNDLGPTGLDKGVECLAELAIAIGGNKPGQGVMLNREIAQLLNHPLNVRMLCHIEQQETPPAQLHKEHNVERLQSRGGDGEEVTGPDIVFVLAQEARPS